MRVYQERESEQRHHIKSRNTETTQKQKKKRKEWKKKRIKTNSKYRRKLKKRKRINWYRKGEEIDERKENSIRHVMYKK